MNWDWLWLLLLPFVLVWDFLKGLGSIEPVKWVAFGSIISVVCLLFIANQAEKIVQSLVAIHDQLEEIKEQLQPDHDVFVE